MGETKTFAIIVVILCTAFTSIGSLFLKLGADRLSLTSLQGILDGYLVIVGLLFYFIGFIMLTFSFRHGELSVLFPFVSLSFVWVAILSSTFLHEAVTLLEIGGVAAIVCGVVLIGISSRNGQKNSRLRLRS
ncbi:EamA family transporter [Candidatus Woesearchaeota archaeon]|nr:EamA family transporter [Candidatus Woesearchaeota archaeon]